MQDDVTCTYNIDECSLYTIDESKLKGIVQNSQGSSTFLHHFPCSRPWRVNVVLKSEDMEKCDGAANTKELLPWGISREPRSPGVKKNRAENEAKHG